MMEQRAHLRQRISRKGGDRRVRMHREAYEAVAVHVLLTVDLRSVVQRMLPGQQCYCTVFT